jgi:hypothetical protein
MRRIVLTNSTCASLNRWLHCSRGRLMPPESKMLEAFLLEFLGTAARYTLMYCGHFDDATYEMVAGAMYLADFE